MDGARRTLLIVTGTLLSLGVVMVYSASFVFAEKKFGTPTYFLQRHAIYLVRPDGYVALADPAGSTTRLESYLDARKILPAS